MGRLSEETIAQIPILYEKYKNKSKVAKELGISPPTVARYLNLKNAQMATETANPSHKRQKTKVTEELKQEINENFALSNSLAAVAEQLHISSATVKKYLTEENLVSLGKKSEDWDALWYYVYRLFGEQSPDEPVSNWNVVQMQKFSLQGMTFRGQLLTLKYFYEVKCNSIEKSRGSVGIIPYIYQESKMYYSSIAQKQKEILDSIQKQLEKDRVEIKYNPSCYRTKKRNKKKIDLKEI